ncbi:hypothetical protein XENOCAPTIV_030422 [Xenoophorus captivus]|uniref:Uncharacterized protein n=1 Tax=Xenoophorus captivus TaxID=1517983 RepID=A0ABV0RW79_9TELE
MVLLMVRFGSSFRCRTDGLTLDSRILCYTEEIMVHSMTARSPGPVAAELAQTMNAPPSSFIVNERFVLISFVLAPPTMVQSIMVKHVYSGLICSQPLQAFGHFPEFNALTLG